MLVLVLVLVLGVVLVLSEAVIVDRSIEKLTITSTIASTTNQPQ